MSTDSPTPSQPSSKLRVTTIILAIVETLGTLSNLAVFGNLSVYRDGGLAQWLLIAGIGIYPIFAITALVFAIKGDVRRAIMAMAAIVILTFLADHLPSMFIHGMEFLTGGISGLYLFAQVVVFPLLAVFSFALARQNERLWLALVLASLTTLANIAGVIVFAIGVAIHGF